jgi:predicted adenylyl cyclase CyaB
MSTSPNRNLELKARCACLATARQAILQLDIRGADVQLQTDTFFQAPHGRLKLRVIAERKAELIWYDRPDSPGARTSTYHLVSVSDPAGLKAALAAAVGVRGVVRKRREIYLWQNVRIHLDDVEGLGTFVELEAVITTDAEAAQAPAQLRELSPLLGLREEDCLAAAYVDLPGMASTAPEQRMGK